MKRLPAQEFLSKNLNIMRQFDDTADSISAIMQAYADHVEQSNWISVEDRLPEKNKNGLYEKVIIETKSGIVDTDIYFGNWDIPDWYTFGHNVKKWRPLPQPKQ